MKIEKIIDLLDFFPVVVQTLYHEHPRVALGLQSVSSYVNVTKDRIFIFF
jgi:hypothetical protein